MIKLTADTINGIQVVTEFDSAREVDTESFFKMCLDTLEDGEVLQAEVSEKCYEELSEKYGIR